MNSLSVAFCFFTVSVVTSDAFNFMGGYGGDKKAVEHPHHGNFFADVGRDIGKFWGSLFKHKKPHHEDDHAAEKTSSWKGRLPKSSDSRDMEAIMTKSMYAQFKAYAMMADAYKLLGDSVRLQREALMDMNDSGPVEDSPRPPEWHK